MRKYILDLTVAEKSTPRDGYVLLKLTMPDDKLPEMLPGQFVEILIDNSAKTFLRRPISINYVDRENNQLWLLIHVIGDGTQYIVNNIKKVSY